MTTLLFITADLILTQALLQPALDQQSKTAMMQLSCAIAAEMSAQTAMDESRAPSADKFVFKCNVHEHYFSCFSGAMIGGFGISLANQRPMSELIGHRTANSFFWPDIPRR